MHYLFAPIALALALVVTSHAEAQVKKRAPETSAATKPETVATAWGATNKVWQRGPDGAWDLGRSGT